MAAGEQPDEQPVDQLALADDDPADLLIQRLELARAASAFWLMSAVALIHIIPTSRAQASSRKTFDKHPASVDFI